MALLNFPSNPNPGDTWTVGSKTYVWSGQAWLVSSNNNFVTQTAQITSPLNSTSTVTGALVVTGGVGIGGDLWLGGNFYVNGQQALTTSSFAYAVEAGTDMLITLSSSTGALIFSNTSTLQTVTSRGNTTNYSINITNTTISTGTTTGALVISGGIGLGGDIWAYGRVNSESLKIEDAVFDSTMVNTNLNSSVVIDSYSLGEYRAAKYFVQISETSGPNPEFQAQEITVVASNTGTADISVYGTVTTNGPSGLGQFDAIVDGSNNVKLRFTPDYATQKTIKVLRIAMTV